MRSFDPQGGPARDAFLQLFPGRVGVAAVGLSDYVFPLFPGEEVAIVKAVAKRRVEFSAGRHCARLAMTQLGYPASVLPSGADRAPVWPSGLTGSITHSAGVCAAVVAPCRHFLSIGIDMEPIDAVPAELADEVLRPDEIAPRGPPIRLDGVDWLTLHFCLKEAAYKAFYPRFQNIISFQEMRVEVDPRSREYLAEAQIGGKNAVPPFHGRFLVRDGRVYAACW
jgi:4'-phosphopantetheinyl transferase EntD